MPLFRRKTTSVPPPPSQQHWVAYMYAPQPVQHVPVHRMYPHPLQTAGPYAQHHTFHLPPAYSTVVPTAMAVKGTPHGYSVAKYAQAQGGPVQYIYQKPSSTYSGSPQHAMNPLPVPQHAQQPRKQRPYSGGQPSAAYGDADRYPFPHTHDEYDVGVQTQPAKQGVFSTLVKLARGRSKSRGRGEAEPSARPRSRASFVDEKKSHDGHDRERGRTKDPRYVDGHRERRLSNDKELKKVKYESQKNFEKAMMETLENSFRNEQMQQRPDRVTASVRRSSTKEELQRRYETEDRLRQQQQAAAEYERSQAVPIPNVRPSPRNRAASPDGISESPTLIEHTKWNAGLGLGSMNGRPTLRPDSGYHTDAPVKSTRRSSGPLHLQMQRLDLASPIGEPAPTLKAPEGFFNQRGDQLMNSKGDILRRPPHLEYPPEFANYPPPGTGWQDHKGQLVGPDLRWIRKVG